MKKISVLCICAVVLCFTAVAFAGPVIDRITKRSEIVIGTSGDYPPFSVKAKDGRIIGLDVDLAMLIAASMGVKGRIVNIPFPQLLDALQAGKIDIIISAMTMLPERNMKVAFVGPYYISGQSMITTQQTAIREGKLKDINQPDFTLAVPEGTTSEMSVKMNLPKAKLQTAKNMDEALKLLLDGKVKAVITDYSTAAVASFRFADRGFVVTPPMTYEPIGMAVPDNDPLLANLLNNLLNTMKGSGALDMLVEKWFKDGSWLKELP